MYFNENDKFPAQWLRNLWPQATVDERSIQEIPSSELVGRPRCHFFGGIGGWEYALQLAGWPDDRPVWTGSCPCQPFSAAGKQKGTADERHLWPEFRRLIAECRPATIFGEQVASKLGREWLSGVRADLEALGYAVGAADLSAASAGAPHIRQRLWWVANSSNKRRREFRELVAAETNGVREIPREGDRVGLVGSGCTIGGLGKPDSKRESPFRKVSSRTGTKRQGSPWYQSKLVECRDGRSRRIPSEPGFFPLAHGTPARVGRLRAYGNAIVPQIAATFIRSFLEAV